MARAPIQVLVLPYRRTTAGAVEYAVFRRADFAKTTWQWIAGGVEVGEEAEAAARREGGEEAGIPDSLEYRELGQVGAIPATNVSAALADDELVPEFAFAVDVTGRELSLSTEHAEFRWVGVAEARQLLRWDSNRRALIELDNLIAA